MRGKISLLMQNKNPIGSGNFPQGSTAGKQNCGAGKRYDPYTV